MYHRRHAFAKRNRRVVGQDFRITPKGARPGLQVLQRKRGGSPPQIVASQKRFSACTQVLFNRSIVFLTAGGAFQLDYIRGFGHHRESLAQAFLAIHLPPRPTICESGSVPSELLNPLPYVTPQ
jgi:hypothetical protein